jgi:hypothetical protein
MRKTCLVLICLVIGCGLTFSSLHAAQKGPPVPFAADFVATEDGETVSKGKYYVAPEGIRMEGVTGGEPYVMIFNFQKSVAWHLMEKERMYIETPIDPEETTTGTEDLFGGFAFGSPCPEQDAEATRLGRETLHGRNVEKWRCVSPQGDDIIVWYDNKLQAGIRVEDEDGTFELSNIKEGRLSGDLFNPPAGYTKLEMPMSPAFQRPSTAPQAQQPGSLQEMLKGLEHDAKGDKEEQKPAEGRGQEFLKGLRGLMER